MPPNIVLIVADDLGYGDLGGLYGGRAETPHLNRLAAEGLAFTDFHSNGAMCSPTRAAILTGRYQQRMGIEEVLGEGDRGLGGEAARGEITLAHYLREAGYATGMTGKWHLGYAPEDGPMHFGFDEFYGHLHGAVDYHSHVDTYGRLDWWHNAERVREEGYVTSLITDHAIRFMERHRNAPFFLYLPHLAIHFPWQIPEDGPQREEGKRYREVSGPLSRLGPHPPEESGRVVRRMIEELDGNVGRVMAALRALGLDDNTLVFFVSDNGGIVEYRGGYTEISSNGPLRGAKGQVYEGGHRVPAVAWWPGHIAPGGVTDATALTMDLLPTGLELAGVKPADGPNALDGISLAPLLFRGDALPARTLCWRTSREGAAAVRDGEWKLVRPEPGSPPELYHLVEDIGETRNLAAACPERVEGLQRDLLAWEAEVTP
ncbi:MAG: sulfatase-like hydrolase/transferase [Armatimonadota bacterium]